MTESNKWNICYLKIKVFYYKNVNVLNRAFSFNKSHIFSINYGNTSSIPYKYFLTNTFLFSILFFVFPLILSLWTLYSKQLFFEAVLACYFSTPTLKYGIHLDVSLDHFADPSSALAYVGTDKLSAADVSKSSAFCRTLQGHVLSSTSAADLPVIGLVKVEENSL